MKKTKLLIMILIIAIPILMHVYYSPNIELKYNCDVKLNYNEKDDNVIKEAIDECVEYKELPFEDIHIKSYNMPTAAVKGDDRFFTQKLEGTVTFEGIFGSTVEKNVPYKINNIKNYYNLYNVEKIIPNCNLETLSCTKLYSFDNTTKNQESYAYDGIEIILNKDYTIKSIEKFSKIDNKYKKYIGNINDDYNDLMSLKESQDKQK